MTKIHIIKIEKPERYYSEDNYYNYEEFLLNGEKDRNNIKDRKYQSLRENVISKIYIEYDIITFEFDGTKKLDDNSRISCTIKTYQIIENEILEDFWEFDAIRYIINQEEFNSEIKNKELNFDFKFTTNESDIDIFLPYTRYFEEILRYFNNEIMNKINNELISIFENNIHNKKGIKKGTKKRIDIEKIIIELNLLKNKYVNQMQKIFIGNNNLNKKIFLSWSHKIAQTLLNVIIENKFQKKKIDYLPFEQNKSCSFYQK
jgi:hypothetical protein